MCPIKVEVPAWEWHGWKTEELEFPDGWAVHEQRMAGHDAKALTHGEISEGLEHPVGTPPLSELAKGRKRCVILFDDMTRPTKTLQMIPAVLDELHAGGLEDDQVVFVMAPGSHGPRLLSDFQKKLGRDVPERFLVFNHNAYENLEYLGDTSRGTPVKINREVMSCDLKVTIGCLMGDELRPQGHHRLPHAPPIVWLRRGLQDSAARRGGDRLDLPQPPPDGGDGAGKDS
jgi:nickel-dependent lactate racemase